MPPTKHKTVSGVPVPTYWDHLSSSFNWLASKHGQPATVNNAKGQANHMYVKQAGATQSTKEAKKSKAKKGAGPKFSIPDASPRTGAQSANSMTASQSVAPVSALIAVQAVDQVQNDKKKAVSKAREILDVLDDMKVKLLSSNEDPQHLQHLKQAVNEISPPNDDPTLKSLLDAVILRASVELAKRGVLKAKDVKPT